MSQVASSYESILPSVRESFPSLARVDQGQVAVYLDGPAGSQVPKSVIEAVSNYYLHHNANSGGMFATSQETNDLMLQAHKAAADWFGAEDPRECVFGANMTTLTYSFSRALAKTWQTGDRIVVTELDHDANVTPWKLAAMDAGAEVATVQINRSDATLDIDSFRSAVEHPRTKLVAFTAASNSVGSRTPVRELVKIAQAVGAEVYVDAVHYAPHHLIDVKAWQADYVVCSAYKFFGPHVGILWGNLQRLEELQAYKLRPSPKNTPGKWMTGTQNFAAIAGVHSAIEHVAGIGQRLSGSEPTGHVGSRRELLKHAFEAIAAYEQQLVTRLIQGLQQVPGIRIYGITDSSRASERVPTIALTVNGQPSKAVASELAHRGIFAWHGDYYAVDVCAAMGNAEHGMVRLGLLHYNTVQEVDRTISALASLA